MNDLEICTRIAEIEGFEFDVESLFTGGPLGVWPKCEFEKVGMSIASGSYNPLTDKALCFDLMVKYDVRVEPSDCSAWIDNEDGYPEFEIIHHKGTLQVAICLAIIKAHEQH